MILDVFDETSEINEGFLFCNNCHLKFPIISKIPIMMENLSQFLTNRSSLGGLLFELSLTKVMKEFLKNTMSKTQKTENDFFQTEKRWTDIYLLNKKSSFYKNIKSHILKIPKKNFVVEYGSSIGIISNTLGLKHKHVFGIDTSFQALLEAKNKSPRNCEYILADLLQNPLGKKKFDLIVVLNMLELVEPFLLLKTISKQISNGFIFLSDPYDYDRGKNSVKNPLDENQIRKILRQNKFQITKTTKKPSKINWNLKINDRTQLNYKVDIILARKHS
jgi:2-polyprenyl-3-methyl-5-hydroxy-6-metoxy-1,4-benzoquinol methylase